MEKKDKLYLLGALAFLVKSFVQEPYEKALITWTPEPWLISTVSVLTVVAVLAIAVMLFKPTKK